MQAGRNSMQAGAACISAFVTLAFELSWDPAPARMSSGDAQHANRHAMQGIACKLFVFYRYLDERDDLRLSATSRLMRVAFVSGARMHLQRRQRELADACPGRDSVGRDGGGDGGSRPAGVAP